MIFTFKKRDNVYVSFFREPEYGTNEMNEKLRKLLFENFKSIKESEFCMTFYFTDSADEAHFLLWSIDGIEI